MITTQSACSPQFKSFIDSPPGRWAVAWSWTLVLTGVFVPLAGLAVAIGVAWGYDLFGWVDLGLLAGMYVLVCLGITVGFHRLFTHRTFDTVPAVQFVLGVLGSMAFEGKLLDWVGRHRLHHQYSDADGDPHSPHAPVRRGFWGRFRSFWHAHIGWALPPDPRGLDRYAPDLRKSRLLRAVSRLFLAWAALGLLIPVGIGYAVAGWTGALTGFLWGGLVRVCLVHHMTWSVNSVCHLWGTRPHVCGDESRNNLVVGVLTLGEGWHNNHHAFPTSARLGHRWWQFDGGYLVIRLLAALGLAWNVRLPATPGLSARPTGVSKRCLTKRLNGR